MSETFGDALKSARAKTCHGCEKKPVRDSGEFVSWLEGMTEQRLYCQACADECVAGLWEGEDE